MRENPHPALRATFSQREKDASMLLPLIWTLVVYDCRYSFGTSGLGFVNFARYVVLGRVFNSASTP